MMRKGRREEAEETLSHSIKTLSFICALTFTFLITGCSLHKSSVTSRLTDMPGTYSNGAGKPSPPAGRWWEGFHDENLNALMEDALQNNLDIAKAFERLQQSRAIFRAANASRGPELSLEGSGGRARQTTTLGAMTDDIYQLSAAASFELDLWGKLKAKSEAARLDALAEEQTLKSLYISIAAQVADLYYLAVEQRAQLALSDQTIASFQDTLDRVERRYREGLVPAIDLYQSRQNLSSAKAQRPVFAQNLATTLNALSLLAGRFPDNAIGGDSSDLGKAPMFYSGVPSQLLQIRPDIRASFMRLQASDERIGAAVADRFPSFNLIGTYGGASDALRSVLDSPNIFWNILVQAAQPVIDSGRRKAEIDRTEAVFREHLADYHKTVLNAFKEVEDALANGAASEERITLLAETTVFSENSLRIALDRYMQGLTDYLPVLTEQLRHFSVRSNLLAARRQLLSDRVQLARVLGGEWMEDEIQAYEPYTKRLFPAAHGVNPPTDNITTEIK